MGELLKEKTMRGKKRGGKGEREGPQKPCACVRIFGVLLFVCLFVRNVV